MATLPSQALRIIKEYLPEPKYEGRARKVNLTPGIKTALRTVADLAGDIEPHLIPTDIYPQFLLGLNGIREALQSGMITLGPWEELGGFDPSVLLEQALEQCHDYPGQ